MFLQGRHSVHDSCWIVSKPSLTLKVTYNCNAAGVMHLHVRCTGRLRKSSRNMLLSCIHQLIQSNQAVGDTM